MARFLTVAEAAEALSVSTSTVKRMLRSEALPARRIGGLVRILESDLLKLGVPYASKRRPAGAR
ncbi:MAG: helix-turn-helix domain-containing protein [Propionibacteriaceae bacterium]|nr:helix-turn-helix domain-containing protein [Propionibacteriaceae bacterium]